MEFDLTYFVTNGTSTANKIVVQSLVRPGDIVLIDRNCHKSHHYGLVLAGASPLYLDAYLLEPYAIYGAVSLRTIKQALLDLEAAGQLGRVRMLLLTNCTFDGVVYNPQRVMEEVLAIKPESASCGRGLVRVRHRGAVVVAAAHGHDLRRGPRKAAVLCRLRAGVPGLARVDGGCGPSRMGQSSVAAGPGEGPRAGLLDAFHPQVASALRQASMIHIRDQDFNTQSRDAFGEAFLTHTSTSPNQQLLASLDLARRQVDPRGSRPELQALGVQLGADVPVFLFGHNVAQGIGEQLEALSLPDSASGML